MTRGEKTNEFADEIAARNLSYDDVQALWHAASWHLVHEAVANDPQTIKNRMCEALAKMPDPEPKWGS